MTEKIRVLMVDDEERFRSTTSKLLSRRGYNTQIAAHGEEALALINQQRPDVVILDIKMPGMDGHEVLARIKEIDVTIPVIMLTGHGTMISAEEASERGAFDYLAKPCDIDLLDAKIRDACRCGSDTQEASAEKTAADIMIPLEAYTTIDQNATIAEGISKLQKSFEGALSTNRIMETGHRSILVMDQDGDLVGILSIRDLIAGLQPSYLTFAKPSTAQSLQYSTLFWRGLFTLQAEILSGMKIKEIMSESPPSVETTANLMEVANAMFAGNIRRVVVTDGPRVVGVVREQEIFFELAQIILKKKSSLTSAQSEA